MKHLGRVHLNGLRAVEAVGRLGSLAAAAQELGVTLGAVSQHVLRSEGQLGHTIFARVGRGMVPTAFGREFLAQLTSGFEKIDKALSAVYDRKADVLTISVAPVLASKWLVPRLGRYSALHPDIQIRLDASVGLADPDAGDIDLCLRVGDGKWPDVRAEFLMPQELFPVCAPALAGKLQAPGDLAAVPIVTDVNSILSWDLWLKPQGLNQSGLHPGHSFTDAALALDAAIAGQGVLLGWDMLAHASLRSGLLVAPFAYRAPTGLGYYLVSSKRRADDERVAGFRRWIKGEVAAMREGAAAAG